MIFILQEFESISIEERQIPNENGYQQNFPLKFLNQIDEEGLSTPALVCEFQAEEFTFTNPDTTVISPSKEIESEKENPNPNKNVINNENDNENNNDKSDNNSTKDFMNRTIQQNEFDDSDFDAIVEILDIFESGSDPDEDVTDEQSHSE